MIDYLKTLLTAPLIGAEWMWLFIIVVSAVMMATAWFRRDVPMLSGNLSELSPLLDWKYFLFVIAQQIVVVSIFFWMQKSGASERASLITASLIFGAIGHFGNRGLEGWTTAMGLAYLTMWGEFHNILSLVLGHYFLSKVYRRFSPDSYNEGMVVWRR